MTDRTGPEDAVEEVLANQPDWPPEPCICSFAARLPFPLRLNDEPLLHFPLEQAYVDAATGARLFPGQPFVILRLANQKHAGLSIYPTTTSAAMQSLYKCRVDQPVFAPEGAYEQWVSMETPGLRLVGEPETDKAYHFHRCLRVLDQFLRSHNLAFGDLHVYPVTAYDLHHVVFLGTYDLAGNWTYHSEMLVHPQVMRSYAPLPGDGEEHSKKINAGFARVVEKDPFVRTASFSMRARRSLNIRGDAVETILSLQIATEVRIFNIWRLLLVDSGRSAEEIDDLIAPEAPFKPLIVTALPKMVGGRWDVSSRGTPVGDYWTHLYLLRNRITHAGYEPNLGEAQTALAVYEGLIRFLRERLWMRRFDYPRTTNVVVQTDMVTPAPWTDPEFDVIRTALRAEPRPSYLPWDRAGRARPIKRRVPKT